MASYDVGKFNKQLAPAGFFISKGNKMAKQTGQITVVKNNTVTNVEHLIRFIFTKNNGERITRDTTDKGVINFDIPNGDWNVSWFAVKGDQKVLPLRAGLQLKITSSTPATALSDWIYGDNTHVADPILTQWTEVLDEMKAVRDEFRKETSFVGDKNEPILRRGYAGFGKYAQVLGAEFTDFHAFPLDNPSFDDFSYQTGFYTLSRAMINGWKNNGGSAVYTCVLQVIRRAYLAGTALVLIGYEANRMYINERHSNGVWQGWRENYSTSNTTPDKNGVLHTGTGTPPNVLLEGNAGLGSFIKILSGNNIPLEKLTNGESGFYANNSYGSGYERSYGVYLKHFGEHGSWLSWDYGGKRLSLETATPAGKSHVNVLHSGNTLIDSNGNYKPASPVIQLHHNRVEYNEDFDKDNPPEFEHLETGVYRITNVREICKDGWTFNKPINGKGQPFFMLKYEQEDETTLIVRVFERTFNSDTGEFSFGEPRDIGSKERWIDFHFEVDHERITREEAQMQKEQEEYEEQERLRKEAEEQAEKEAQEAWEAEIARQEAEMLAEVER